MKGRQRVSSVDRRGVDRVTSEVRTNKTKNDTKGDTLRQYANIDINNIDKQSEDIEYNVTEFRRAQVYPHMPILRPHAARFYERRISSAACGPRAH